jgi:TolB protein
MRLLMTASSLAAVLILASGDMSWAQEEYQLSLKRLTTHPGVDYYPSWSPNGDHIVFSSSRLGGHLWRVPAEGGTPVQVTSDNANHPSWSPEGSFIAFDTHQGTHVGIVHPDGGVPVRIDPDSLTIDRGAHPCWSPDGRRVAFTAQGEIWAIDLPTGELTSLYRNEGHYARVFSWAADGSFLTADMDTTQQKSEDDIWLLPTDGRAPKRLTEAPGREGNPLLSPDETMIVYMDDRGGEKSLWVIPTEGGTGVQLTPHEGFNANPRWSPDGTKIAFASDRGGNVDIWVMELDLDRLRAALGL